MARTDLKTELTNAKQQIYCLKTPSDRCAYFRCFLSETAHYLKHPSESYTISRAKSDNQGTDIQWNPLPVYATTWFFTTIFTLSILISLVADVQTLYSATHCIIHYPVNYFYGKPTALSAGQRFTHWIAFYPTFEQLGPDLYIMKKLLVLVQFGRNACTLNYLSDLCVCNKYNISTPPLVLIYKKYS